MVSFQMLSIFGGVSFLGDPENGVAVSLLVFHEDHQTWDTLKKAPPICPLRWERAKGQTAFVGMVGYACAGTRLP